MGGKTAARRLRLGAPALIAARLLIPPPTRSPSSLPSRGATRGMRRVGRVLANPNGSASDGFVGKATRAAPDSCPRRLRPRRRRAGITREPFGLPPPAIRVPCPLRAHRLRATVSSPDANTTSSFAPGDTPPAAW